MKIALITDNRKRVLQGKTMYDSLDTDYIIKSLAVDYSLTVLTHHELQSANTGDFDYIIFTTSQVYWYKQYVELNINFLDKSKLIPSIESLLSHENKAYEYMWLKAHTDNCLPFKFYSDLDTYLADDIKYPIVIKTPSGSSSRGVKICNRSRQATKFIKKIRTSQMISELAMTPFIQWPHHLRETKHHANFVTQKYIQNYHGDYRVQIMGDKFFVYYRQLKANKQYTSGHGSINNYQVEVDPKLLETAATLQQAIGSPHIIFDFIFDGEEVHVLEFSAIHPSNVALDNCKFYYQKTNAKWSQHPVDRNARREDYYVYAYKHAINKRRRV